MGQYFEAMPKFSVAFETLVFPQSCDEGSAAEEVVVVGRGAGVVGRDLRLGTFWKTPCSTLPR